MENLRRLGGEAGVVAGVAMAWLFLGLVVVFPASGLDYTALGNPHRYLPFVAKHEFLFWTVNILGGLLAGLMSTVLFMALGDRFRDGDADGGVRVASTLGVIGAAGLAASAMIRQFGIAPLAAMYASNQVGAVHAFRAMNGIANGFTGLSELFVGVAALAFTAAMLPEKHYRNAGMVGAATGVAMILSAFVSHVALVMLSTVGAAVWFVLSAIVMRSESGPAFFRWAYAGQPRSKQRAA